MSLRSSSLMTHIRLLFLLLPVFLWSAFRPKQMGIWMLEVTPLLLGIIILLYTYKTYPLTTPVYGLLWVAAVIMLIGGHYGYSNVPIFNWLKDYFQWGRNHYDRLAHFYLGLAGSMLIREILLRQSRHLGRRVIALLVCGLVLGISALYELLEGLVVLMGGGAEQFVGMQGDTWDSHWDMFLGLAGSVTGLLLLSRVHDRHLARLKGS